MKTAAMFAVAALLAVAVAGCKDKPQSAVGVGVVDLDRAADELGVNKKYQEYLNAAAAQVREKLNDVLVPMQQELDKRRKKLADAIKELPEADRDNPEVVKKSVKIQAAYKDAVEQETAIRNEVNRKQQALNEYDQRLKEAFQHDVQPAVSAISQSNGVQVMILKKFIAYSAPKIDLTNELIQYLKDHPIKPLEAPPTTW